MTTTTLELDALGQLVCNQTAVKSYTYQKNSGLSEFALKAVPSFHTYYIYDSYISDA